MPWDAVGSGIGAALRAGSGFGERRTAIRVRGRAAVDRRGRGRAVTAHLAVGSSLGTCSSAGCFVRSSHSHPSSCGSREVQPWKHC